MNADVDESDAELVIAVDAEWRDNDVGEVLDRHGMRSLWARVS